MSHTSAGQDMIIITGIRTIKILLHRYFTLLRMVGFSPCMENMAKIMEPKPIPMIPTKNKVQRFRALPFALMKLIYIYIDDDKSTINDGIFEKPDTKMTLIDSHEHGLGRYQC